MLIKISEKVNIRISDDVINQSFEEIIAEEMQDKYSPINKLIAFGYYSVKEKMKGKGI